jgi:uncharacterized protein YjbI with pentapeptide repeats
MDKKISSPPPLTLDELSEIIAAHRCWLRSEGKEGQEADLSGANLEGLDLSGCDLSHLNFWRANLARVKFGDAHVEDASFWAADLREAELNGARGLLAPQVSGSDLSGANLPEGVKKFESLPHINAAIRHTQTIFFTLLLVCVFCWLTIAITTDAGLITNTVETQLPVINTKIDIAAFYIASPLLLLCLFFYFHLFQLRLWEAAAGLPAIFPDGRALPHHLDPWFGSGLLWVYSPRLTRPALTRLQNFLYITLSWWIPAVTLFALWWRALRAHEWILTGPQIASFTLLLVAASIFTEYARAAFRLKDPIPWWRRLSRFAVVILLTGCIAGSFFLFSRNAFNDFENWIGEINRLTKVKTKQQSESGYVVQLAGGILLNMRRLVSANLVGAQLSKKPPNWSGKAEDVYAADLKGKNLCAARADGAFLVRADMRNVNMKRAEMRNVQLQGADLTDALLQRAILMGAQLQEATLTNARLQGADLLGAQLQGAWMRGAQLQGANLAHADLEGADLVSANLQKPDLNDPELKGIALLEVQKKGTNLVYAHLQKAKLGDALLQGVDLTQTKGLTPEQVKEARGWVLAKYSTDMLRKLKLPKDHNDRLDQKDLSGYDLREMTFRECDLAGFILQNTRLHGVNLSETQLQGADLRGAKDLEPNQVKLSRGWPLAKYSPDLLTELKLPKDHNDRLNRKDFSEYDLVHVYFTKCSLLNFIFKDAHLEWTNFRGADLKGADLSGAQLHGANLRLAKGLTREQLRQAKLGHFTQLPPEFRDLKPPPPSH